MILWLGVCVCLSLLPRPSTLFRWMEQLAGLALCPPKFSVAALLLPGPIFRDTCFLLQGNRILVTAGREFPFETN